MKIKPRNIKRMEHAERGALAISDYRDHNPDYHDSRDRQRSDDAQSLTDLLADLRHYCQRENIDFDTACIMSEIHYQEEK